MHDTHTTIHTDLVHNTHVGEMLQSYDCEKSPQAQLEICIMNNELTD